MTSSSSDYSLLAASETPAETPVPGMDPVAVKRWAQHVRPLSPWLHEEVGTRMAQRLHWIKQPPASWLDWEPVRGGLAAHHAVREVLPNSKVFVAASQSSHAMNALQKDNSLGGTLWSKLRGRAPVVATSDTRVDMVWANMSLHATHQPQALLQHWHQHLQTDGFLMFSCLGPDSLQELGVLYEQLGWAPPGHAFTDMHDWGDMLVQVGFAEPVMDAETITLTYASVAPLLADLRALGRNLHEQRSPVIRGRNWLAGWQRALEDHLPRTPDGQMRLTFEVAYGHAFKPKPRLKVAATSAVSLRDMREMLASPKRSRDL
jgi:malonyl-CoA O-methyltransferase